MRHATTTLIPQPRTLSLFYSRAGSSAASPPLPPAPGTAPPAPGTAPPAALAWNRAARTRPARIRLALAWNRAARRLESPCNEGVEILKSTCHLLAVAWQATNLQLVGVQTTMAVGFGS